MKEQERKRSYPSVQAVDPKEISRIRISMGLSQESLAERLHINEKTVRSAENGKRILEIYAKAIAKELGKPAEELFDFPDQQLVKQAPPRSQELDELANDVLVLPEAGSDPSGKEAPGGQLVKSKAVILDSPNKQPPIYLIFSKAIFLTGVLLIVNWIGEQTTVGRSIKLATYGLLQHRLTPKLNDSELPVVVVDISNLLQSSSSENQTPYTSRSALQNLVAAAAGSGARAVGVDIDFSPDQDGYIGPGDPEFFQFCLRAKEITGAPIYLGIYRSRFMPSSAWLGEERYKELAATIMGAGDDRRMVRWLQTVNSPQRSFSMSASLAGAVNDSEYEPQYGLRWAIQSESDFKEGSFSEKEFWIDYGPLNAFERHVIRAANSAEIRDQSKQLQGKVVLFGDIASSRTRDMFTVPGRKKPVPEPLIHACATYTLLNRPLYSLTFLGRMVIDLIISLLMIGGLLLIQMRFNRKAGNAELINVLQTIFVFALAAIIILVGWGLVDKSRLMWDDFLLVALMLLACKPIEQGFGYLKHNFSSLRQSLSQAREG